MSNECDSHLLLLLLPLSTQYNFFHDEIDIKDSADRKLGYFQSKCPSWGGDLTLYSVDGDTECARGYSNNKAISWGRTMRFYDADDQLLAMVEEGDLQALVNSFSIDTEYNIYGSDGTTLIGYSERSGFFETRFDVKDMNGKIVATSMKSAGDVAGAIVCIAPSWNGEKEKGRK
jgi:hypothetical protein